MLDHFLAREMELNFQGAKCYMTVNFKVEILRNMTIYPFNLRISMIQIFLLIHLPFFIYVFSLVMSPNRAELPWAMARAEGFSAQLGPAYDHFQLEIENWLKKELQLKNYFWLTFIINLFWKWLNYAAKSYYSTLKRPFCFLNLD